MDKQKHKSIGFFFPLKNGKLIPVLYEQVTTSLLSVRVQWHSTLLARQAQMTSHHTRQKNYRLYTIAHVVEGTLMQTI